MAERGDITIEWPRSPRIIRVARPSTDLLTQDLVDTCRAQEALVENLDQDRLILDAAGKQDIGNGVEVGITAQLNNAVIQFEQRAISVSQGTSQASGGEVLNDLSATFITDGVLPGATVVNFTDQSIATVLEVVSETQIETTPLEDGSLNVWTLNDAYKIWNVDICQLNGGNVVAQDDLAQEISPLLAAANVAFDRQLSSATTALQQGELQRAAYNDGASVLTTSPYSGTAYPNGTLSQPVNNLTDAVSIAQALGVSKIYLFDDLTVNSGSYSGFHFVSVAPNVTITNSGGATFTDCVFENLTVAGNIGNSYLKNCFLGAVTLAGARLERCIFTNSAVTFTGASAVTMTNCAEWITSGSGVTFNLNSFSGAIVCQGWFGRMLLDDKPNAGDIYITFGAGSIDIPANIAVGTITLSGNGSFTLDPGATATVNGDDLMTNATIGFAAMDDVLSNHNTGGSAAQVLQFIQAVTA